MLFWSKYRAVKIEVDFYTVLAAEIQCFHHVIRYFVFDYEANEALVATESHYSKPLEVDLDRFRKR